MSDSKLKSEWDYLSGIKFTVPECPDYVAHPQAVWFEQHWRPVIKALLAERDALKAKYEELLSYLPNVPADPYEKELAKENAALKAENKQLRAYNENSMINKRNIGDIILENAALRESLKQAVELLERLAKTDTCDKAPDFHWLNDWRNEAKMLTNRTLASIKQRHGEL